MSELPAASERRALARIGGMPRERVVESGRSGPTFASRRAKHAR